MVVLKIPCAVDGTSTSPTAVIELARSERLSAPSVVQDTERMMSTPGTAVDDDGT